MSTPTLYTGPIFDSHIHLYDPARPEGIAWPAPSESIYGQRMPSDYWTLAEPANVVGAIVIEASPRREDNNWILQTLRQDPRLHGFIGNLNPFDEHYRHDLEQLSTEPLFLGLRYGNLWDRDLLEDQQRPGFMDGMRQLADYGRCLDSANPDHRLLQGLLRLSDQLPELRIIIDHLPSAQIAVGQEQAFEHVIAELAQRPQVFAKLAQIPQMNSGELVTEAAWYRDHLHGIWEAFGEDRCFFGSDWPNSDRITDFVQTLELAKHCVAHLAPAIQEKFFALNALRAYAITP